MMKPADELSIYGASPDKGREWDLEVEIAAVVVVDVDAKAGCLVSAEAWVERLRLDDGR
jgi:hypothetical protein